MTDVEVLMKDGCIQAEAENHLKKGIRSWMTLKNTLKII